MDLSQSIIAQITRPQGSCGSRRWPALLRIDQVCPSDQRVKQKAQTLAYGFIREIAFGIELFTRVGDDQFRLWQKVRFGIRKNRFPGELSAGRAHRSTCTDYRNRFML